MRRCGFSSFSGAWFLFEFTAADGAAGDAVRGRDQEVGSRLIEMVGSLMTHRLLVAQDSDCCPAQWRLFHTVEKYTHEALGLSDDDDSMY